MEYTRRISRKEKCYFIPDSVVVHETNIQSGSDISKDDESRLWRYEYAYRNESYMFKREGISGLLYQRLRLKNHLSRIRNSSLSEEDKKRRTEIVIKNDRAGKSFNPTIEYAHSRPVRVLQIFGEPLSNGGQESAIMNFYKNIDRKEIQFDFFTPFCLENEKLKKEIESLGGKVFAGGGIFNSKLRKLYFTRNTKSFLLSRRYGIIHINSGSVYNLAVGAKIARKSGARKVIVHSHAAGLNNLKHKLVKIRYAGYFRKYPTKLIACSDIAAQYKYPDGMLKADKIDIINNGVDTDIYKFRGKTRKKYRHDLGLDNNKVIIHVGRMSPEKNQIFILKVLKELVEISRDYRLIICGDGALKAKIVEAAKHMGVSEYVSLLGVRGDIPELLSAADLFILPSLWEGAPVSAIEAQSAGLPVVCSDTITKSIKISDKCIFVDLSVGPKKWASEIDALIGGMTDKERDGLNSAVQNSDFDAKRAAKIMEKVYLT
jgi:glycosyltransferase involved in cell wall biosynthesis